MARRSRDDYPIIERTTPLLDFEISRAGDGRTVTAYVATFDEPYPVVDQFGDYDEEIDPAAFNRELGRGISHVQVLYNHGLTIWGTPSEQFSKPVGKPLEIRPDGRGLLTVTRYNSTPLADEILEMYRSESIRTHSFRGRVYQSAPDVLRNGRAVKRRTQMGLKEYGPTPFPANDRAELVALRSTLLAEQIEGLDDDERDELIKLLQRTPDVAPSVEELGDAGQSSEESPPAGEGGQDVDPLILANAQRRRRS